MNGGELMDESPGVDAFLEECAIDCSKSIGVFRNESVKKREGSEVIVDEVRFAFFQLL